MMNSDTMMPIASRRLRTRLCALFLCLVLALAGGAFLSGTATAQLMETLESGTSDDGSTDGGTLESGTSDDGSTDGGTVTGGSEVVDEEPPVITCPLSVGETFYEADAGQCTATVDPGTATATDNEPGVTVTGVRSDGQALTAPYPVGTTTITWTATDAAGNQATCTQTVTVVDGEDPVINCPANIEAPNDRGQCSATVDPGTATATDNCPGVSVSGARSDSLALTAPYPVGTTTITWTATDAAGNQATCTQSVIVSNTEVPVISCPADIQVPADAGQCTATVDPGFVEVTSSNCPGVLTFGARSDALALTAPYPVGTTTIIWTAIDASGNQATCSQSVIVQDMEAPAFENCPPSPASAIATCTPAGIGAYVSFPALTATDTCGSVAVAYDDGHTPGSFFSPGNTTVIARATDGASNQAECPFIVTVAYAWSGVLQPIRADGSSVFRLGQTIPVKFALTGDSACVTTGSFYLYLTRLSDAVSGTEIQAASTSAADSGNRFRYDGNSGQYVFNLGTKELSEGTWQLRIDLGDGSTNTVQFSLMR